MRREAKIKVGELPPLKVYLFTLNEKILISAMQKCVRKMQMEDPDKTAKGSLIWIYTVG